MGPKPSMVSVPVPGSKRQVRSSPQEPDSAEDSFVLSGSVEGSGSVVSGSVEDSGSEVVSGSVESSGSEVVSGSVESSGVSDSGMVGASGSSPCTCSTVVSEG